MLIWNFDLLFDSPGGFLILLLLVCFALLVGITVHEFSHALAADRLGDPTARYRGRLSLNPLAHLDPMGALMLLLVGFGWGKPVPVNAMNLQSGRRGMALVAASGPISNLLVVFLFALPLRFGWVDFPASRVFVSEYDALTATVGTFAFGPALGTVQGLLAAVLAVLVMYNIILAVFNLLPVFPLDGSNILLGTLPADTARAYARLAPYGPVVLLVVIMLDYMLNWNILGRVIGPVVDFVASLALR